MVARELTPSLLTFIELVPNPCVHESVDLPNAHPSMRERWACLEENGNPKFTARGVLRPRSHAAAQRRYRARLKLRARELFGGYCYGCGANGSTPLEFAHVLPTGLDGPSRGTERKFLDVLAHPFHYVPLCRACHLAFGGPERWS